ncbi:MAG: ComF family protein [Thermoanaerobaculia bacterium]
MFTETGREPSGPGPGAAEVLAGFLFPSRCLACRRRPLRRLFRGGVCEDCWRAVALPPAARCAVCDETTDETVPVCGRCLLAPPPFAGLRGAAPYRGAAREIVLAFKFRGADYLARRLAAQMCRRLPLPAGVREVTAVPATRRARRASDHAAELLGAAVASAVRLPFAPGRLEKVRETERQSRLPLSRREGNVRGAFRVRGICRGPVLLVDDVVTSGATARECAGRLRAAGAASISVWCFARASRGDVDLEPVEGEPVDGR